MQGKAKEKKNGEHVRIGQGEANEKDSVGGGKKKKSITWKRETQKGGGGGG